MGRYGSVYISGMAGRGLTAEAIDLKKSDPKAKETGIRDRLKAHRDGRSSGDQFSPVYVFDRLVLKFPHQEQLAAAVAGKRKLDEDVQKIIHMNTCTTGGGRHPTAARLWP